MFDFTSGELSGALLASKSRGAAPAIIRRYQAHFEQLFRGPCPFDGFDEDIAQLSQGIPAPRAGRRGVTDRSELRVAIQGSGSTRTLGVQPGGSPNALPVACVVTFLHYVGAYMRVPVMPLYASAFGASATDVGLIIGAHMMVAALTAVPFGRASDRWGRRALLLGGTGLSSVTSFLLPLVDMRLSLIAVYGIAGLGVAAFTPSIMSLVGDIAPPGTVGRAYGWYTTALYSGMGMGPLLGGYVAQVWGYRIAFVVAGAIITAAVFVGGAGLPRAKGARVRGTPVAFIDLRPDRVVWAGWIATLSALVPLGTIMTFFPLLGRERGMPPVVIGLVLGVQSLVNTAARVPAGHLLDRVRARRPYAIGGCLAMALGTALLPHLNRGIHFVLLAGTLGASLGVAFVAVGAALSEATTPATRGLAMGGYSTAIYAGFGLGAVALAPVMGSWGYTAGFTLAAAAGALGSVITAAVWRAPSPPP